jgi:hypothetical protein
MPSCKVGHVYIVFTALTRPPKEKYALCVSAENEWFVWFNTNPRHGGDDQLLCKAGCHELIEHDSYLDLRRVVMHSQAEIDAGKEFACISPALRDHILAFAEQGLKVMPKGQCRVLLAGLRSLA